MVTSWYERAREFKSPVPVVAAFLLRSRETLAANNRRRRKEIDELKAECDWQARQLRKQQQTIDDLKRRTAELQRERDAVNLPEDPPIATHGYGARMISLAVNVARSVGLRGAERVLRVVFDWLGLEQETPTRTAIRNWLQRLAIYVVNRGPSCSNRCSRTRTWSSWSITPIRLERRR